MSALEEPEPFHPKGALTPEGTRLERAAWWAMVLHALCICLNTMPWYHPGYRVPVEGASVVLMLASALAIALVLIPSYVRRGQWGRLLGALSAGLVLFIGNTQAHAWRGAWTHHLLQTRHCHDIAQAGGARVLGGLVRAGGLGVGDSAEFINSTHCLIAVCKEEIFQCPRPELTDDARRP